VGRSSTSVLLPAEVGPIGRQIDLGIFPGRWAVVFFCAGCGTRRSHESHNLSHSRFFALFRSPSPAIVTGGQRCAKSLRRFGCDACDGSTFSEYLNVANGSRGDEAGRAPSPSRSSWHRPHTHSARRFPTTHTACPPRFRPLYRDPRGPRRLDSRSLKLPHPARLS
jgi:hypothetical protein